jgi:hypothetical protein
MATLPASYVAVSPASQNSPMERRELLRVGKTWAVVALVGIPGKLRRPVWVERIWLPSASRTVIGKLGVTSTR